MKKLWIKYLGKYENIKKESTSEEWKRITKEVDLWVDKYY